MTLYFVVRTDASGDSGTQRVFGAFDIADDAAAFMTRLKERIVGQFAIYEGKPA